MTATFAQTQDSKMDTIEGIALRRPTLQDANTIAEHRRSMFHEIGYRDGTALDSMMENSLPWLKARIASAEFRRKGLARWLVEAALPWCKVNEIDFVILHASPQGRKLYESLGFQAGNEMGIKL